MDMELYGLNSDLLNLSNELMDFNFAWELYVLKELQKVKKKLSSLTIIKLQ